MMRSINARFFSTVRIPYNETTCSNSAYQRGSGQKIVGFSIYGDLNSNKSRSKGKLNII